jgi:hypothetical protein
MLYAGRNRTPPPLYEEVSENDTPMKFFLMAKKLKYEKYYLFEFIMRKLKLEARN